MIEEIRLNNEKKGGFLSFVVLLLIFIIAFNILNTFVMIVQVDGSSMNNTLSHGDILVVDRKVEIERGDVVIFDRSYGKLIKRVIAIEGDEVYSENGEVYLKKVGETEFLKLEEGYINGITDGLNHTVVGENKVFVLGDNRINSKDSRDFGAIDISTICGEVSTSAIENKGISTFLLGWIFKISDFLGGLNDWVL